MSEPDEPALDPARAFGALSRFEVEFVLVGGLAAQARGATRVTRDLDICPAWTTENLERLAAALKQLGARIKIGEGSIDTLEVALDAKTISNLKIGAWRTVAGDIDVLLGIPSVSRFELARYQRAGQRAGSRRCRGRGRLSRRPIPLEGDRRSAQGSRGARRAAPTTPITVRTGSSRPAGDGELFTRQ